jgi:hypothetical protein
MELNLRLFYEIYSLSLLKAAAVNTLLKIGNCKLALTQNGAQCAVWYFFSASGYNYGQSWVPLFSHLNVATLLGDENKAISFKNLEHK